MKEQYRRRLERLVLRLRKEKEKDNKDKKNEPKPLTTPDEARKLQIGTPLIDNAENMKPLSIAVEELYEGKVKIVSNGDDSEIM